MDVLFPIRGNFELMLLIGSTFSSKERFIEEEEEQGLKTKGGSSVFQCFRVDVFVQYSMYIV